MLVLVNLDAAVVRRRHMTAQLDMLGIPFDRTGFDGRSRPVAEIEACARERFGNVEFDFEVLSGAEAGCWISHLSAWDRLRSHPTLQACAVIEDDVLLAPEFAETVARLSCESPYDIVYLGTSSRNISVRRRTRLGSCWLHEPVGTVFNTWGYVVARAYVERFFAEPRFRIRAPIDHFIGGNARQAKPTIAVLQPPVVFEHTTLSAQSQIEPHTNRIDRWKVVEGVRRRLLASRVGSLYYSLYRLL